MPWHYHGGYLKLLRIFTSTLALHQSQQPTGTHHAGDPVTHISELSLLEEGNHSDVVAAQLQHIIDTICIVKLSKYEIDSIIWRGRHVRLKSQQTGNCLHENTKHSSV